MDIWLSNKQKIALHPTDFVAQGGEGAVYVQGKTAYKIYADPARALPVGKVSELSTLTQPRIIKPESVVRNKKGEPVGYTMRALSGTFALCQLFTRAFRDRHQITPDQMFALVQAMQAGIAHVHDKNVLVVDLSEMNFVVAPDFSEVFFIDVDSYQTPHFPATALTESIRDRHSKGFCPGTDWFSFAVVSFQMLTGIHPYKGKHPALKTLDERMLANVSVLNKSVTVPAACQPFSVLPPSWRDWYEGVLEKGERVGPPQTGKSTPLAVAVSTHRVLDVGAAFTVLPLQTFEGAVVLIQGDVVVTTKAIYQRGKRLGDIPPASGLFQIALSPVQQTPIAGWIEDSAVRLWDAVRQKSIPCVLAADALFSSGGRLYARRGPSLLEIQFTPAGQNLFVQADLRGTVLEKATTLWEGVALQSLVGACYASLLPRSGVCCQVRMPELDPYQIVSARFEKGVLIVVGNKNGNYDRWVFRFDDTCQTYDARVQTRVDFAEAHFAVLDSGIVLDLLPDDVLEVFSRVKGASGLRSVPASPTLGGDCRLGTWDGQAAFARGETLYRFSLGAPAANATPGTMKTNP